METWIIIVAIIVILVVLIILRVAYELRHLMVTRYNLESEKISDDSGYIFAFLSDLHYREYGENNEDLIKKVKSEKPDAILLGGDMMVDDRPDELCKLYELLKNLREIAPVYYAYGNHECRYSIVSGMNEMAELEEFCRENDIKILKNEKADITDEISIYGLNIDMKFYTKFRKNNMTEEDLKENLSSLDKTRYNILLAHNPKYFNAYRKFDCDLILAGHYHGGAVRIGKFGIISPQFTPLPKHSGGLYEYPDTKLLVTRGAGSHKVNLRLFNKPEIVVVKLNGAER